MSSLETAIALALKVHAGQFDKAGLPYILHPLRIMGKFNKEHEKIVSVLHDVVEDCSVTLEHLAQLGFSEEIIYAIDCLTKQDGEPYMDFIIRLANNKLAQTVKIEDIKDNLDITRLSISLNEKDIARIKKYHEAYLYLTKHA